MVCGQNDCTPVQAYIKETKSGKVSLSWPIPNMRHHGEQGRPALRSFGIFIFHLDPYPYQLCLFVKPCI